MIYDMELHNLSEEKIHIPFHLLEEYSSDYEGELQEQNEPNFAAIQAVIDRHGDQITRLIFLELRKRARSKEYKQPYYWRGKHYREVQPFHFWAGRDSITTALNRNNCLFKKITAGQVYTRMKMLVEELEILIPVNDPETRFKGTLYKFNPEIGYFSYKKSRAASTTASIPDPDRKKANVKTASTTALYNNINSKELINKQTNDEICQPDISYSQEIPKKQVIKTQTKEANADNILTEAKAKELQKVKFKRNFKSYRTKVEKIQKLNHKSLKTVDQKGKNHLSLLGNLKNHYIDFICKKLCNDMRQTEINNPGGWISSAVGKGWFLKEFIELIDKKNLQSEKKQATKEERKRVKLLKALEAEKAMGEREKRITQVNAEPDRFSSKKLMKACDKPVKEMIKKSGMNPNNETVFLAAFKYMVGENLLSEIFDKTLFDRMANEQIESNRNSNTDSTIKTT